jgi:hypothetical protein
MASETRTLRLSDQGALRSSLSSSAAPSILKKPSKKSLEEEMEERSHFLNSNTYDSSDDEFEIDGLGIQNSSDPATQSGGSGGGGSDRSASRGEFGDRRIDNIDSSRLEVYPFTLRFKNPGLETEYKHWAYTTSGFRGGKGWFFLTICIAVLSFGTYHWMHWSGQMLIQKFWVGMLVAASAAMATFPLLFTDNLAWLREAFYCINLLLHWPAFTIALQYGVERTWERPLMANTAYFLSYSYLQGCLFFCTFLTQARFCATFPFLSLSPLLTLILCSLFFPKDYWATPPHGYVEIGFWVLLFLPVSMLRIFERASRLAFQVAYLARQSERGMLNHKDTTDRLVSNFYPAVVVRDLIHFHSAAWARGFADTTLIAGTCPTVALLSANDPSTSLGMLQNAFVALDIVLRRHPAVSLLRYFGDELLACVLPSPTAVTPVARGILGLKFCLQARRIVVTARRQMLLTAGSMGKHETSYSGKFNMVIHTASVVGGLVGGVPISFDLFSEEVDKLVSMPTATFDDRKLGRLAMTPAFFSLIQTSLAPGGPGGSVTVFDPRVMLHFVHPNVEQVLQPEAERNHLQPAPGSASTSPSRKEPGEFAAQPSPEARDRHPRRSPSVRSGESNISETSTESQRFKSKDLLIELAQFNNRFDAPRDEILVSDENGSSPKYPSRRGSRSNSAIRRWSRSTRTSSEAKALEPPSSVSVGDMDQVMRNSTNSQVGSTKAPSAPRTSPTSPSERKKLTQQDLAAVGEAPLTYTSAVPMASRAEGAQQRPPSESSIDSFPQPQAVAASAVEVQAAGSNPNNVEAGSNSNCSGNQWSESEIDNHTRFSFFLLFEDAGTERGFREFLRNIRVIPRAFQMIAVFYSILLFCVFLSSCLDTGADRWLLTGKVVLTCVFIYIVCEYDNHWRWYSFSIYLLCSGLFALSAFYSGECTNSPNGYFHGVQFGYYGVINCMHTQFHLQIPLRFRVVGTVLACGFVYVLMVLRRVTIDDAIPFDAIGLVALLAYVTCSYAVEHKLRDSFAAVKRLQLRVINAYGQYNDVVANALEVILPEIASSKLRSDLDERSKGTRNSSSGKTTDGTKKTGESGEVEEEVNTIREWEKNAVRSNRLLVDPKLFLPQHSSRGGGGGNRAAPPSSGSKDPTAASTGGSGVSTNSQRDGLGGHLPSAPSASPAVLNANSINELSQQSIEVVQPMEWDDVLTQSRANPLVWMQERGIALFFQVVMDVETEAQLSLLQKVVAAAEFALTEQSRDVKLVKAKSFGKRFLFLCGDESAEPSAVMKSVLAAIADAAAKVRLHMEPGNVCNVSFKFAIGIGGLHFLLLSGSHRPYFDIVGPAISTALLLLGKTPNESVQLPAGSYGIGAGDRITFYTSSVAAVESNSQLATIVGRL